MTMDLRRTDPEIPSVRSKHLNEHEFRVDEVAPGSASLVGDVAVFNVAGHFCATEAKCPHMQGPLNEGKLDGSTVTCPWHGSEFDVCTGAVLSGPAKEPVKTYPVVVEGEIGRVNEDRTANAANSIRHYSDDAIEISYDVHRCIHAEECIHGLPAVFDSSHRPWVMPSNGSADEIAAVISKCPSGALHFKRRDGGPNEKPEFPATVVPIPGGPLYVRGLVQIRSADGTSTFEDLRMALCRCGKSQNKPFCDNSHISAGFDDPGVVPNFFAFSESQ